MSTRNSTATEKTDWRRQAREIADSLAIAFILAMVIRHFVLEVFKIPTKSMQPTLLGDPYTGDKILVNKFAYDFRQPERWEVAVFKYPVDTSRNYIKRVVGLPGDTLRVYAGDVYLRRPGTRNQWDICRKPWRVQQALWRRRHCRSRAGSFWVPQNPGAWSMQGTDFAVEAHGGTERLLFTRDILAYEEREFLESRRPFVRITAADLLVQFGLVPDGAAEVEVDLEIHTSVGLGDVKDRWTVRLPTGEGERSATLLRAGSEVEAAEAEPFALPAGERSQIQVCNVDHTIIVRVDGRQVVRHPYRPVRRYFDVFPGPQVQARPAIGCREGRVVFHDPALFVDVYYTSSPSKHAVDEPYTLGPGEFFVLGDNSANSNDSRKWGVVPESYLVGEAFLVLWPLGRMKLVR